MWGESSSPANSGRDRAIETLIDMEPHGPFYRAARVLDEAVPRALSSRPNLVTRAALVEQANSLAQHEIDSLDKFEEAFPFEKLKFCREDKNKDRILRHHAKMVKLQRVHHDASSDIVATPPPQLVAALRRVYGTPSESGAVLRSLLRQVMDHKVFCSENKNQVSNDDGAELPAANLESIVGNICRVAVEENNDDGGQVLQGLLIATLSILTGSMLEDDGTDEPKTKIVDGLKMATARNNAVDSLKPIMPALQVGGVMSLLASVDTAEDDMFTLDADLLKYLGEAASVYEERIEIQKARVLARLQAESEREAAAAAKEAAAKAEKERAENKEEEASDDIPFAPVTPPSGNGQGAGGEIVSPDSDAAIIHDDEEEEETDEAARMEEEDAHAPSDEADRVGGIVSEVSGDETSSAEDPDEVALRLANLQEEDSSDGDSTNSDDDNESAASSAGYDVDPQESDNPQSAHLDSAHHGVDVDDMSSSSSSSSDDEDDVLDDDDEMLVDDEEAVDSDDEEEDDAMLRQALALSLAEHSSSYVSGGNEASGEEQEENDSENDGGGENENDDEGDESKLASMQSGLGLASSGSSDMPSLEHEDLGLAASESSELPSLEGHEAKESAEDENGGSLPPLPAKPSHYPYHMLLKRVDLDQADFTSFATEDVASEGSDDSSASYLEPSALSKFGTLPAAHVVVHMLQNAIVAVQGRQGYKGKETEEGEATRQTEGCSGNSVPGGIGSSLFVPRPLSYELGSSKVVGKGESSSDDAVSVQLLVAAFVLFSECRKSAIESLRQAILLEHQNAGDSGIDEELKEEEDGVSTPTSDEEDDPAVALAMNYASSPSHASSSISESLETKGMKRKAAAAVHDAALLLKSLRKRTEAWKQRVQFYSHCTLMVMRCLRMYLQSVTRHWLNLRSDSDQGCLSLVERAEFLPSTVLSKLSDTLTLLMSVSTFRSFSALFTHDDAHRVEELLLPLKLYHEAVLTWGECVPLLYPTSAAITAVLSSLINDSHQGSDEVSEVPEALDSFKSLPSSEWQPHLHRLRFLCQRMRVSDLLDSFVSHPISYDPSDSVETHEILKLRDEGGRKLPEDPDRASSLVSLVGSACKKLRLDDSKELQELYFALCHKCNVRTLLWDGFLACSNDDADDRLAPSATSPSLASSDILGVASNPSSTLQFDASKCSDSIAILSNHRNASTSSNGASVHQRASKVWGTVLSSSYFSPRTGVHRWAVRLDRCERGHVFVGVSTSQASLRTYVGGDKFGWGVIGTQALWHDRRKIRGDYGATFRTGSTIVVTLDTDAGTLSFSSWKDSNSATAAFSLDALLPSLSSPSPTRRPATGGGGIAEDWGVAFEGLPLDSRLYPAVGLYQRDDRVTLLSVESGGRSSMQDGVDGLVTGGACYYPRNLKSVGGGIDGVSHHRRIVRVRRHNDLLMWDGVQYVTDILHQVLQSAQSPHGLDDILLTSVLPSIAASICLMPPSIPVLSVRSALSLLPQLNGCIRVLDALLGSQNKQNRQLFSGGLRDGKWIMRATGSSGTLAVTECEEYVVNLTRTIDAEGSLIGFHGTGVGTTGKSKNGLVSIMGAIRGSSICFVEEWTDGNEALPVSDESSSSCVIAARLSLDGCKFEGTYRNVQYGTTGNIAGMLCSENRTACGPDTQLPLAISAVHDPLVTCEALLCLAHGHLVGLLGTDTPGDHAHGIEASRPESYSALDWKGKCGLLKGCLLRPLLCEGFRNDDDSVEIVDSLREFYSFPLHGGASVARGDYRALDTLDAMISSVPLRAGPDSERLSSKVVGVIDGLLTARTGGNGSLSSICPLEYTTSRHRIICALAWHCGLYERLVRHSEEKRADENWGEDMLALWRAALRIMEDGMRKALSSSKTQGRTRREVAIDHCALTDNISTFLAMFRICACDLSVSGVIDEFFSLYSIVECQDDLDYLESEMQRATKRAVLRTVSLQQMKSLLSKREDSAQNGIETSVAIECCTLILPRLLGRGLAEVATKKGGPKDMNDWSRLCNDDLGGYYLTHLSASGQISNFVQGTVHSLFRSLGELIGNVLRKGKQGTLSDSWLSTGSLLLSFLATFTATIRFTDVNEIVLGSGILHHLPKIMSEHREAIRTKHSEVESGGESDRDVVIRGIYETVSRDISRAVLRACVSVVHVIGFQLARQASFPSRFDRVSGDEIKTALQLCVDMLHGELVQTLSFVRSIMQEEFGGYRKKLADEQSGKWCEVCVPTEDGQASRSTQSRKRSAVGTAGLMYLIEHGTLPSSSDVAASSQKLSSRPATPVSSGGPGRSEQFLALLGAACHQYVSQLLNILSGMNKFPASLSLLSNNRGWMGVLLQAVGLSCVFDDADGCVHSVLLRQDEDISQIPVRYRMRILRLLLCLISQIEPNEKLVESLFVLAGSSNSILADNMDDDENSVSREVVSLLRRLYSLSHGSWRECIHRVLNAGLAKQVEDASQNALHLGILAFFSGSVTRICRGSYVLLKPSAAAPLSSDVQSSSSSKSHGSSGGSGSSSGAGVTPHHIVGNGTEGVIAGLCRAEALAGIVSSVDVKSCTCEVILTSRHMDSSFGSNRLSQAPLRARSTETADRGASSARYTMTVRALRAPLSDVVNAEEVPLLLGAALPTQHLLGSVLASALSSLSFAFSEATVPCDPEGRNVEKSVKAPTEEDLDADSQSHAAESSTKFPVHDRSQAVSLCVSLMALRSATTVLCDEQLLSKFVETLSAKRILAEILELASCELAENSSLPQVVDSARVESLSSLPTHEARFCHLSSMLREIGFRKDLLDSAPMSHWEKHISERAPRKEEIDSAEEDNSGGACASDIAEGYSTPPATASSVSAGEAALATSAAGDDDDSGSNIRNNPPNSQLGISQQSGRTDGVEEDEDADSTAAVHLLEAAIAQMAELGLPRPWCEYSLRRTGNNVEAAVHFCLERGGDMDRLLAEERERERMMQRQNSGSGGSRRRGNRGDGGSSSQLLRQLLEMGFPSRWCAEALAATRNNVDEALTWILTNGERLSAEDEGMDDVDDDDDADSESGDDDESADSGVAAAEVDQGTVEGTGAAESEAPGPSDMPTQANFEGSTGEKKVPEASADSEGSATHIGWSGSVTPLRFISGRSIINPKTLEISGLPTGGFSSVGTKGVLLTSGKWYYEAILESAGCLQIGWADGSFAGHCHADRGDGCGDGPSSWAYDGWRRYRWHACATEWGCRWKEGDIVGCLVDMDERVVSFTLNGRGKEIGMGVAFTGNGFRPCGGVYACVSFNRREKLRLILGGKGSEPFKYKPPSGYRGVGDAVLESADELDVILQQESVLNANSSLRNEESESKKFLCDFSDGEHGHELFAWQHRYYGSDASVHLGSGRSSKQSNASQKYSGGTGASVDSTAAVCVSRRVEKLLSNTNSDIRQTSMGESLADAPSVISKVKQGYEDASQQISSELWDECVALGVLYSRKFILHLIATMGANFDLTCFIPQMDKNGGEICNTEDEEVQVARQIWRVLDVCVSLRSAGWVGEAGAMAVAAEALGLGISSNDHHSRFRRLSSEHGGASSTTADSSDKFIHSVGGVSQLLSTTLISDIEGGDVKETARSFAACAEAAIGGGGGGGPLVFLQRGLQSAVRRSEAFRRILIAVVRRSVRLLAVVDYAGNDSATTENIEDEDVDGPSGAFDRTARSKDSSEGDSYSDGCMLPDARLACFLTGLLLSRPVQEALSKPDSVMIPLFEAWSIGLLSASSPWRMVCGLTASGILNECPAALPRAVESLPALANLFRRLDSTVVRRVWAERAASPICSRFVHSMIELLASVKRASHIVSPTSSLLETLGSVSVDAATPLPLEIPRSPLTPKHSQSSTPADPLPASWEWEEGWVASDAGWELWSGTIECMAVDWKTPSRSAVRTLMDGGDGPPMLSEGCYVMRGLDWSEAGSGSKTGQEDGKDLYEAEKARREEEKRSLEEEEKTAEEDPAAGSTSETEGAKEASTGNEIGDPVVEDKPCQSESPRPSSPAASDKEADGVESKTSKQRSPEKKKKGKKIPSPKLPIGTVLSIEPWDGIPAMARRVRWHLTGVEGVYRYGGQGGRYDISHVEVNEKSTRVRKRHPFPESAEQCASRHGFGASRRYSVLLRLRRHGTSKSVDGEIEFYHQGILEWPDFGAAIRVDCILYSDGAVSITERELLFGSKDSGWEARFGQPSYHAGTVIVLNPTSLSTPANQADLDIRSASLSFYEELLGSSSFTVETLRNRADGSKLRVTSEMKLLRARRASSASLGPPTPMSAQAPLPPPICFDHDFKASSLSLSRDGRTVSCIAPDGRSTAFGSVGFTKGVHYWEVKLEQADIGSVFIGVAEKPSGATSSGGGSLGDIHPRLNRWHGWGFVNFRATYTAGAERVYGAHCHSGDTVGVLLDCDAGRVSFFCDHLKYGEHILNDLGCAFENISPFGFNADGCGNGGAGQGAPSGVEGGRGGRYPAQGSVRPKALWPVVGLRTPGDRVTISSKWMSSYGIDGVTVLKNVLAVDEILCRYDDSRRNNVTSKPHKSIREAEQSMTSPESSGANILPKWFIEEAYAEYERWCDGRWYRSRTRGSGPHQLATFGLDVDLDTSPLACASACAALGSKCALLSGDRVVVKRSAGRMLELAEEAVVLGAYQGRLFYRIVAQKNEGGSLTEGGGRAWFWDESEVVENGLQLIGIGKGLGVPLPLLDRFRCTATGGLKIVYEGGAVVRSDLEIFDGSQPVGSVPVGTVIPQNDVLERRVNSCGVVRYRIRFEAVGEGWISSRIRGGREESIVVPVHSDGASEGQLDRRFQIPHESAMAWYEEYQNELSKQVQQKNIATSSDGCSGHNRSDWVVKDVDEFEKLLLQGTIAGLSTVDSDELVASAVNAIADFSAGGDAVDCSFADVVGALSFAVASQRGERREENGVPGANQAAAAVFSALTVRLPSTKALLARIAVLRAFNRRARFALPWLSIRPSHEGSAIFGGLCGHGASIERAGRNMNTRAIELWFQPSSIASRVRSFRSLFFRSVKRLLLDSITEATTTPTPLSHDEYELPREIRTVRINRLKAIRAMAGDDNGAKRKHSVFSQLHNETRSWGGAALRRGFVAKGHGGQKRAFKVKLIGEGVNDYSGPYREAFTDAAQEVTAVDGAGHGALGVLEPTPNNFSDVGENRELFMFSTGDRDIVGQDDATAMVSVEEARIRECFASLTAVRNESSREVEESLVFLGRMSGTACRHGITVDLPLPLNTAWKALVEETSDCSERLHEVDLMAFRQLDDSIEFSVPPLLCWQQRMLNSFVEGMSNVLPVEIFPLFTGVELRDILCGNPDVDVELLRRVVEYEGYEESDDVVAFFWEALREMSNEERKKFLQFVWARTRLPMKESDFDAPFKIQRDSVNAGTDVDMALPSASTCFFSLTLPNYSSKKVLKEKLLFAIENVCTMESDYVTNDAEVGEGWRGL